MTVARKALGRWGEALVDEYMLSEGWTPFVKNTFFRGGEIDRIYKKEFVSKRTHFCVAEIKTTTLKRSDEFLNIFSEIQMQRFMRPRQIKNLVVFAEKYARYYPKSIQHLRVFVVVVLKDKNGLDIQFPADGHLKPCVLKAGLAVVPIKPEVTEFCRQKSLLQTYF